MELAGLMSKIKCDAGQPQIACHQAREARDPAFMFQEGIDPTAQKRFQEIARLTSGAYHGFDRGCLSQLAELLRAVAAFSVGGITALERQRGAVAKLLLGQVGRDHSVCAGRDGTAYLFEMFAHRRRVGVRHDDGDAGVTAWADGAEQIGVLITLIFRLPWTRALLGRLIDERVLLPDPRLILEPHLN
jgi:hypothetical protein